MLRLRPVPSEQTHEEVFLERYQRLYGWLVQFTDGDRDLARDLVQDAFVHFTFVRPDLREIRNLDAYLFELARNLHLSQVRRAINSRVQQLSIIDYDSSELGLRATDLRDQIQVQDELRRICHYACVPKRIGLGRVNSDPALLLRLLPERDRARAAQHSQLCRCAPSLRAS